MTSSRGGRTDDNKTYILIAPPFIIHRRKGADDGEPALIDYAQQSQHQHRLRRRQASPG